MHDIARACLVGSLVLTGLVGAAACWPVAPDSAKDVLLGDGSTESTIFEGSIFPDGQGPGTDGSGSSGGGDGSSGAGDAEAQAPLVISPTASPLVAEGAGFGCRIDSLGNVGCWGDDTFGQAGSTPTNTPLTQIVQVAGISNAAWMALGDHPACAVTASHAVYCWGLNVANQLGHAAATEGDQICPGSVAGQTVPCTSTPTLVGGISPAAAIAAAGAWTCIVATDGTVQCWGAVQTGATDAGVACGLGTQAQGGTCYPAPYTVTGVGSVTQLAVGNDHACAIVAGGGPTDAGNQVACWGDNNEAQVSPTACPGSNCVTPLTRSDLPTSAAIAAGNAFTCALGSDGLARCFGDNTYGELGHTSGSQGDLGGGGLEAGLGVFNPTPMQAS